MSINPIGISNPNQTSATDPNSFQTRMQQALAPVAQLFGESSDQLMAQLNSGNTSLSALASAKGISQTDLVNAIKQGLQSTAPAGASPSDTQLTNIANRIANHKHGGHHHHRTSASTSADMSAAPTASITAATDPNAVTPLI